MRRHKDDQYVLSLSYGKDSMAAIEACRQLWWPIDRIVHAEVWATDDILADPPEMIEFKKYADKIIKKRYGIEVEHLYAVDENGEKMTYEKLFYSHPSCGDNINKINGFPGTTCRLWCKKLKEKALLNKRISPPPHNEFHLVKYLGIAPDEPERVKRHRDKFLLPLVEIGWDENYCREWCKEHDLLSPVYNSSRRGGCWFCHLQPVNQLRLLYHNNPDLWQLLMKWDLDSPTSFYDGGRSVHDFARRFQLEDEGTVPMNNTFRWKNMEECE